MRNRIREDAGVDYYSISKKDYEPIVCKTESIVLKQLKAKNKVIHDSEEATLYDIGNGVICLQLNRLTVSQGIIEQLEKAQQELKNNWEAMVITGIGKDFSFGVDLTRIAGEIENRDWEAINNYLKKVQNLFMANKYSEKPVVFAPVGRVLGSGCEMVMQGSAVQAAVETYMGMIEMGLGLIPACGGTKEMTLRGLKKMFPVIGTNAYQDFLMPGFENIAKATVSTSSKEAKKLGLLKSSDGITLNEDLLITDAKKKALDLVEMGYTPPKHKLFPAPGKNGVALIKLMAKTMMWSGYISEYDYYVLTKLVDVMGGGNVISGAMINEEYLLDLEREAYISLLGEKKTQDRIKHMLIKGKPLHN